MASTPTNGDDILNGTAGDDIIKALGGNDTLKGLDGNDSLNGGTGVDTMYGGNGEDTYFVDHADDRAIETVGNTHNAAGRDVVRSTVSYTIGSYIEDLYLSGDADLNANGNSMANRLYGNKGANTLNGRTGADRMTGGDGNDIYVVDNVGDRAFETNADRATGGIDTVKSSVSFTLGANVEKLTLTGNQDIDGTGNAGNNSITGNAFDNTLLGGDGNDVLTGGRGGDEIEGGAGSDRIVYKSALDSTGIDFDTITGFNFEEDKIDLPGAAPQFVTVVEEGRLDKDTFDADLNAAVGAFLQAGTGAVFVPDSGDFEGKTFFILDGNGQAGYQAGGDYVVRIEDSPIPTNSDFFI
jgi:Ca2+-binding RTX toxin-like protein